MKSVGKQGYSRGRKSGSRPSLSLPISIRHLVCLATRVACARIASAPPSAAQFSSAHLLPVLPDVVPREVYLAGPSHWDASHQVTEASCHQTAGSLCLLPPAVTRLGVLVSLRVRFAFRCGSIDSMCSEHLVLDCTTATLIPLPKLTPQTHALPLPRCLHPPTPNTRLIHLPPSRHLHLPSPTTPLERSQRSSLASARSTAFPVTSHRSSQHGSQHW